MQTIIVGTILAAMAIMVLTCAPPVGHAESWSSGGQGSGSSHSGAWQPSSVIQTGAGSSGGTHDAPPAINGGYDSGTYEQDKASGPSNEEHLIDNHETNQQQR